MPLTFDEAYKIVKPKGGVVLPDSKDFRDIMELMRQSGYVSVQQNMVTENVPRPPKSIDDARVYTERPVNTNQLYISKRQWMSVAANRAAFMEHLK
jgi:hypothetical protein